MPSILKQYRDLECEKQDLEQRILNVKKQLEHIENMGTVKDSVSGGNGGIQHFVIEGVPLRDYTMKRTRLLLLLNQYENDENELSEITSEALEYIHSIEDARDRLVCKYYFIDGYQQDKIAEIMNYTRPRISQIINKYIY